jgi:hypothetical protein
MQPYVTLHPGRTPAANITNTDHYKLDIQLHGTRLIIRRWQPETDWTTIDLFLDADELERIRQSLLG